MTTIDKFIMFTLDSVLFGASIIFWITVAALIILKIYNFIEKIIDWLIP